jgi:hypothetical protein
MNSSLLNLTSRIVIGAIALVGFNPTIASANHYYSSTPVPPAVPEYNSSYYITTNVSGDDFYGGAPYYSQQTADGNIWVTSIILMKTPKAAWGSYIQISCGHKQYRDLIPWVVIDRLGSESVFAGNYNWQYFRISSAFEKVGKQLCDRAASDRGVYSVW